MFLQNLHISISPYQNTRKPPQSTLSLLTHRVRGCSEFSHLWHMRFLVLESIIRSLITILSILYCQTTNTSILIISARNTATLAYPVANRNIDVVRNRTSHDAFVHILSAHFGIVLVVSYVYPFRHTSAKAPIQMTNDYIAKQENSRYLCIVSSPLSGKRRYLDLNQNVITTTDSLANCSLA